MSYSLNTELNFSQKEDAGKFYSWLKETGYSCIAGLDEAGRGPLAGPVVVASVILPEDHGIEGIKDSKIVSKKKRIALCEEIVSKCLAWGVGVGENTDIDAYGIRGAVKAAGLTAVNKLSLRPNLLLCDGNLDFNSCFPFPYVSVVDGDAHFEAVSAASIIAKVWHDNIMNFYHGFYPEYNWEKNQGYGTKEHLEAIKTYGVTDFHRKTFGICKVAKLR